MMHYWLTILGLKGDVWCTSWVTHLARNLGLLANATITYITTPRWIIDYVYFNKAHMLKRGKNGKTMMMYKDYTNEFEMPDQNLGLHVVSLLFFICKRREQNHIGVPLLDSHATQTQGIMVRIPL
jgi:hypothetical protein